jgi:hypothetical protein
MGDFVDVIDFEKRRYAAQFAVHVSVLTKTVFEKAWGNQAPHYPRVWHCTVRESLGGLPSDRTKWWDMSGEALVQIAEEIQASALPFLAKMHSREHQIRNLRARVGNFAWITPVYEAILMFECGEREEACSKLKSFKSKYSKSIERRVAEIAQRLNCH